MTTLYGPDINTKHGNGRAVLDLAWTAGDRFVAIKAGGGNVGIYTAPDYVAQVEYARAKGYKIVHYWVSGNQAIAAQARAAIAAIKPNWRDGDAVGWDNEKLDSTGQIRNDADSALWITTVAGTAGLHCPDAAVWHYGSSGSTFRSHGAWPKVKATHCTIWAAAYPGPPSMSGTGLDYQVHQYTSAHEYGDGQLTDRNKTSKPLTAVFPKRPTSPAKPTHTSIPKTTTSVTGSPGKQPSNCWKRLQYFGSLAKGAHRYVGPDDGRLGVYSWEGVQQRLADLGFYTGIVDGEPYTLTYTALQAWAGVKVPQKVTDWTDISRTNWRAIGRKLNLL